MNKLYGKFRDYEVCKMSENAFEEILRDVFAKFPGDDESMDYITIDDRGYRPSHECKWRIQMCTARALYDI